MTGWQKPLGVVGVLLVMLLTSLAGAVRAQDGGELTPEQTALLDRVVNARANLLAYTSYQESASGVDHIQMMVTLGGEQRDFTTAYNWFRESAIVRQDGVGNVQAMITVDVYDQDAYYAIEAEARLVDGALYVAAAYEPLDDMPAVEPLPDGWVLVEDLDAYPAFDSMHLEDFVEPEALLDDSALITAVVSGIESEDILLEDAPTQTVIRLAFDAAAVRTVLAESPVPNIDPALAAVFLDALADDSAMTMMIVVDEDDNPLYFSAESVFQLRGLDGQALDPNLPAGVTIDLTLTINRTEQYSAVGEPVEPVAAPEIATS